MSNVVTTTRFIYQGPLGQVVRCGVCYFASKDGFPLGTYSTFEEAMESLYGKEESKQRGMSRMGIPGLIF